MIALFLFILHLYLWIIIDYSSFQLFVFLFSFQSIFWRILVEFLFKCSDDAVNLLYSVGIFDFSYFWFVSPLCFSLFSSHWCLFEIISAPINRVFILRRLRLNFKCFCLFNWWLCIVRWFYLFVNVFSCFIHLLGYRWWRFFINSLVNRMSCINRLKMVKVVVCSLSLAFFELWQGWSFSDYWSLFWTEVFLICFVSFLSVV